MTYRDRRLARADRLREWSDKRVQRANATLAADEPYTHDIAFLTQPGRIPERSRMNARADRAYVSLAKAESMTSRADNIDRAATHAIYTDDADAIERLRERIADLEAQRYRITAYNASCRSYAKVGSMGDRSILDQRQRDDLANLERYVPNSLRAGHALPAYAVSNLSGNISKQRERLARMERGTQP